MRFGARTRPARWVEPSRWSSPSSALSRWPRWSRRTFLSQTAAAGTALAASLSPLTHTHAASRAADAILDGRIVAQGIPGAGALSAVGVFHPGGPIKDKAEFAAFTQPGRVLDSKRLLAASTSNFGAPLAQPDAAPGAILSLDPRASRTLVIPASFAAGGGQESALDGQVLLYTAQSPAFVNRLTAPGAVTADIAAVSNPLAISLNNAFGRPWFANAPRGVGRLGTETVIDPSGVPLAGAPSPFAGGVFAGEATGRRPQLMPGSLGFGALGTALLGRSPDGSGRAVFAVVCGDGSVIQVHVEKGVDGLAPAGTVGWFSDPSPAASARDLLATRAGMLLNWVPDPIVYVADPMRDAVVALTLVDDGTIFQVERVQRFELAELDVPVDLAPAIPEIANAGFASNTTLAGASDLYVANRGNGTIARLAQDGTVIATRQVAVPGLGPLGAGRLNGIAVSSDAQTLWVAVSGPVPDAGGAQGAIVEIPAFGAGSGR